MIGRTILAVCCSLVVACGSSVAEEPRLEPAETGASETGTITPAPPMTAAPPATATPPAMADGGGSTPPSTGAGNCFEIFGSGWETIAWHSNPLPADMGRTAAGTTKDATVSYYNFCGDSAATVLAPATFVGEHDGFAITESAPAGTKWTGPGQHGFKVRFASSTPGTHTATVRFQVSHGYYDTNFTIVVE
jgi:hypothetical protein